MPKYEAQIDIQTLEVIEGKLPRRALSMVLEWANEHRAELMFKEIRRSGVWRILD